MPQVLQELLMASKTKEQKISGVSLVELNKLANDLGDLRRRWQLELTTRLGQIKEKDHPLKCPTGLFVPMGLGRFETAHTRALAWLLNPEAAHGFKNTLLDSFLELVWGKETPHKLISPRVRTERYYRVADKMKCGRTDIWIDGEVRFNGSSERFVVVVEAKIDAPESDEQLARHDKGIENEIKRHRRKLKKIYRILLTPKGAKPLYSKHNWDRLSFETLAEKLWNSGQKKREAPGFAYLRLYLAGLFRDVMYLPCDESDGSENQFSLLTYLRRGK